MKSDDRLFAIIFSTALLITVAVFLAVHGVSLIAQRSAPAIASEPPTAAAGELADQGSYQPSTGVVAAAHVEPPQASSPEDDPAAAAVGQEVLLDAVAAVAAGRLPSHLQTGLPSLPEVLVREDRDGRMVVAPGTQRRYDRLVGAITALDPEAAAAACHGLVRAAGSGQPNPDLADANFELQLRAAIDHLLAVRLPEVEPDMRSLGTRWGFADPEYEQLSEVQQHLLLMGGARACAVQARLLDLKRALDSADAVELEEDRLARQGSDSVPQPAALDQASSGLETVAPAS